MGMQKYEKLVVPSTQRAGRAAGMRVIADYVDPASGERILLLERPESAAGVVKPKRTRRTPAQIAADNAKLTQVTKSPEVSQ